MLSFIVPAYNEEAVLPATLTTLLASAASLGRPFEVIVADDASTDRTAEVARSHGATVVPVSRRQIAAVRNAGARAARGDVLFFVDADTLVPANVLRAALAALAGGAVGGGSLVRLDPAAPLWGVALTAFISRGLMQRRLAAGCFVFARRDTFDAVGGWDEKYFAAEEIILSLALKRKGRFVVVPKAVITSARKFRLFTPWQMIVQGWKMLTGGGVWRREALDLWYDGRRER
jgi:glycosyltransferase involved in cell wall biosynthesis